MLTRNVCDKAKKLPLSYILHIYRLKTKLNYISFR